MRTPACPHLFALLVLAAPSTAQGIQIRGETTSVVGVYAGASTTSAATRQLPKAMKFTTAAQVKATSGSNWAEAKASISGGKATVHVGGVAVSGGLAGAYADAKSLGGSPQVRFTFQSSTAVSGRMVVVMTPTSQVVGWGNLVTSEARVKVGNHQPGTASLSWAVPSVTREFAATLDSTGTPVDISVTVAANATTTVTFGMDVVVWFEPGHRVTAFGENCADLHSDYPAKDTIDLHLQGVLQGSPTLFSVGFKKVNITIGWPGCRLLVDPVVIVAGPKTDSVARARLRLPLPNEHIKVLVQGAIYEPWLNVLQLSNGLEMEIVKR